MITAANAGPFFFLYAFAFLESQPKYMCQLSYPDPTWTYGTEFDTLKTEYCAYVADPPTSTTPCQINWDDPESFHNIIEQLDFYCVPGIYIGVIGALFLLGMCFGCLTVAHLGDKYGRKFVFNIGLLLNILASAAMILSHNWIVDYCFLFIMGIAGTMRMLGYTYNVEMV